MSSSVKQQTNELLPHGCYITLDEPEFSLDVGVKPIRVVDRGKHLHFTAEEARQLRDALTLAIEEVDDDD